MRLNPLHLIDGYKIDHRRQYPPGTTRVYSNWTPRGSRVQGALGVVFFGLQYFLMEYLGRIWTENFFNLPQQKVLDTYERRINRYAGPNTITLEHIEHLHGLGYLPLSFRAMPEGSFVPLRVPCLTVENTHDFHAWLVNYTETLMSNILWKPCTSATTAGQLRGILEKWARRTGGSSAFVDWQGHDFSMRGMSGIEDAMLSGAGHLIFFEGTDTVPAIDFVEEYYHKTAGGSVFATEHSVMSAGERANELATYRRLLNLYPSGVLSVVSDTWDLWNVLTSILPTLKEQILARDGKLVIRPDSGDPVKIICGDSEAPEGSPARKGVIQLLWDVFGGTLNELGYRTLDPHIGAIYGDSINRERMNEIQRRLAAAGFASDNMVFGIGSFTYEFVTRDTYGFAMKATHSRNSDGDVSLYKSPVTDSGEKWSARGRLAVVEGVGGQPVLICDATREQEAQSLLTPVWENGVFHRIDNFTAIRERARRSL